MFLVRTMQLSGGLYSYNRFDAYEESLSEGSGASTPEKMKKKVDKESKKARKTGRSLVAYDEKEEEEEESEGAGGEAAGGAMGESVELNKEETKETVMENRMAMYSRALGVMGAHYSGPGFGVSGIEEKKEMPDFIKDKMKEKHDKAHEGDEKKGKKKEDKEECNEGKKADKDYDGDGKVESSKAEYFGSKDKAIKKAMKENREMAYGGGKAGKGSGDGSKPAGIKGGKTYTMKGKDGKPLFKEGEEVSITKEAVVEYLVTEGYANNEVSAEILHQHISDEFLAKIEEQMVG